MFKSFWVPGLAKVKTIAALAAVAAMPAFAAPVGISDGFTSFYSFGDSLSDDGKFAGINTAFNSLGGRFSDGLVWAELIEDQFIAAGKGTANFALGGATAAPDPSDTSPLSSLPLQTAAFLDYYQLNTPITEFVAPIVGTKPLLSLWAGANDILDAFAASGDTLAAAMNAAGSLDQQIRWLATNIPFASDFLVVNMPDLGRTPLFNGTASAAAATAAAEWYNRVLAVHMAELRTSRGLNIYELDAFTLMNEALDDPSAFGYASATLPCIRGYIVDPTLAGCAVFTPAQLLFADSIHPNSVAHQKLATAAEAAVLGAVPLPASASMVLAAFAALGLLGLRRRVAA